MPKYGWGAVTVPGVTSGWAEINKRFGKLSLSQILEPAASYARDGFPVSPVVSALWNRLAESFKKELSPEFYEAWAADFTIDAVSYTHLIGLWHGDIVLEPARDGLIHFVDHAQGRVAVLHRIHDDPHRENIIDLVQGLVLVHHLLIYAEKMLHTAADLTCHLRMLHVGADLLDDLVDEVLPGLAG